jgi:hypothetical protein
MAAGRLFPRRPPNNEKAAPRVRRDQRLGATDQDGIVAASVAQQDRRAPSAARCSGQGLDPAVLPFCDERRIPGVVEDERRTRARPSRDIPT